MALSPGTRFGPYEIADSIGAGGMGEVYRATDTDLKREVAIKVLPEAFASDADRLARFRREAELLASLNHVHIAHIYGLERSDGMTALAMELVEGPTLAERIEQGPMPVDEALSVAMQIAEALAAAHERGIVHRDLKPANIKLRPDGAVKVLDFGIAKALDTRTGISGPLAASLTTPAMTEAGFILGTAAYMSPEQARGKPVDQRADIWAFGCVLYEMLTGQPAFGGEEVTITLARILERDADMSLLPPSVSPAVRKTIELCLEKDPKDRLHAIGDARLALMGRFESEGSRSEAVTQARPAWRRAASVAAAFAVGGLLVGLAAVGLRPSPTPSPVNRFDYDIPESLPLRATGRTVMALSPDGRNFVINTSQGLFLRSMDELEAHLIPGTEAVSTTPIFSPDGQSLAYMEFNGIQLKRVAITGGTPVVVASFRLFPYGMSWSPDGTILVGQAEGIFRVPENGGEPELIVPTGEQELLYGPELLPDGDSVLFTATTNPLEWDEAQAYVVSLSTGERRALDVRGSDVRYVPTGHLIFAVGNALFAVAFDLDSLSVSGGAMPLAEGLMRATANITAAANYGVSNDGTLAYLRGTRARVLHTLVWVDREGRESPIDVPPQNYTSVRLSPDGSRVALDTFGEQMDIWIWDFGRELLQKLTRSQTLNSGPIWTPDAERIIWSRAQTSAVQEVFWQAADGSGTPQALTMDSRLPVAPTDITADGAALLYSQFLPPRDVRMISMQNTPMAGEPLIATAADETNATVSPDGRWLAYQSSESGIDQVYVRPFPDVDSRVWQISIAGGTRPLWSADGRELIYYVARGSSGAFMAASVELEPSFNPSAPRLLFEGPYVPPSGLAAASNAFYDVSSDGQRFLIIKNAAPEGEAQAAAPSSSQHPQVIIVENWFEELERPVPAD